MNYVHKIIFAAKKEKFSQQNSCSFIPLRIFFILSLDEKYLSNPCMMIIVCVLWIMIKSEKKNLNEPATFDSSLFLRNITHPTWFSVNTQKF